jgi:hypothetical protein
MACAVGNNKKKHKETNALATTLFITYNKHNRLCRESTQPVVMIAVADL